MNSTKITLCFGLFSGLLLTACKKADFQKTEESTKQTTFANKANPGFGNGNLPISAIQTDADILFTNTAGANIYNGGFGSAVATYPGNGHPHWLYLMTDRGPNVDYANGKLFPVPNFHPQIGLFKLEGDKLEKINVITMKDPNGNPITGLPNPIGLGSTGEIAYDNSLSPLAPDPYGLDPEGLVALSDGSFWVSDEYGPHLVHFDQAGRQLERVSPFANGGRQIPAVFINRRANRGMEGLTITPDGEWLVGMMQSPLDNPRTSAIRNSRTLRILFFNLKTGLTKQYLYQTEQNGNLVSDITAINDHEFYVLERDGEFPLPTTQVFKRVYRINIQGASDVSDPSNSATGKLFSGKTIEQLIDDLASASLTPVSKQLSFDIIQAFPQYAHDKVEGIALQGNVLIISNDDDFGIVDNGAGGFVPKYLPYYAPANVTDRGEVLYVNLQ